LPWGVSFPEGSIPYWIFQNTPLHPAQVYSSLYGVILFVLLHFVLKKRRFVGQPVALLFMAEAVFRFAIEYVRFYEDAMHFSLGGLDVTYNQVISVGLFLLGAGIYLVQARRSAARLR
jgi:phosphatidylglycerol:prolipoprotein diacylglycerol transferase